MAASQYLDRHHINAGSFKWNHFMNNADHSPWAIFLCFLKMGLTSFGGPVAHIGYFRDEFVTRRQWLSERSYADLVALCQFLPGPASSQVGMALGLSRGGFAGSFAAWFGFTLPSAVALIVFALGITNYGDFLSPDALHGLKLVAVAVVAQAVWGMAVNLCPDTSRISLMAISACLLLIIPSVGGQIFVIIGAGLIGLYWFKPNPLEGHDPLPIDIGRKVGVVMLTLFFVLLAGLPVLTQIFPNQSLALFDAFYRAGALVFGGGHVVLPLLQAEVVPTGWVDENVFLAGYGAAQAAPGPLFTFAAFLGASLTSSPSGWLGAIICLLAIFVPSFLLIAGALPFWEKLRLNIRIRAALMGVNAAVVGVLFAALYQPIWTSAIHDAKDLALALLAFVALMFWKLPPWLVVIAGGIIGGAVAVFL